MESSEFDSTIGGSEHLPFSANSLNFTASRSIEIAAMTESILRPSKTKLIFQTLPVHMRRRVMSHNTKRLPKRLREGHLEQLKKSGLPPKQKRPSRKHRRRPANLLEEYNRRQKHHIWLQTHIWHAKRFHMINRWGYRLAHRPCDKAFRACYRASSAHCLLQDISYYTPIQISGTMQHICDLFSSITSRSCGLSISAKAYAMGTREGAIHIYEPNAYPFNYVGKVQYFWTKNETSKSVLWLYVHPSFIKQLESIFSDLLNNMVENPIQEQMSKKRKLCNQYLDSIEINGFASLFNRFRLTGPKSQVILAQTLKCIENESITFTDSWVSLVPDKHELYLKEKYEYWENMKQASSPSLLPPSILIGLVVKDPRLSRPKTRIKAQNVPSENFNILNLPLMGTPTYVASSPIWDINIHKYIKENVMSNGQYIQHISETQLVPGEINENDPKLQCVPIVLIQRPGSQTSNYKKIGYGSGWDVIVPSGYGLPFWQTFIMFGARSGGLREMKNLAFEMGECYFSPDSNAGKLEEKRIEVQLREKYFRLPPSKRVNYQKLGIVSPFICPWKVLLSDWSGKNIDSLFILRDKSIIDVLQQCFSSKYKIPHVDKKEFCLVAVHLQIIGKGNFKPHALICMPQACDYQSIKTLLEPHHEDRNEKTRKEKRLKHLQFLKQIKKKRRKVKQKGLMDKHPKQVNTSKTSNTEPSEYVKSMRELWVPSNIKTVQFTCLRPILGYLTQGSFSFTQAQSCGIGYIAFNSLEALLQNRQDKVLVRNTTSRKYRLAKLQLIKCV